MEKHSQVELLRNSQEALTYPGLVKIVQDTDSPSSTEQSVLDAEYPLNQVRSARYLAMLKRDFSKTSFNDLVKNIDLSDISGERVFSCYWGERGGSSEPFDFDEQLEDQGQLIVTPHEFLPPLFWDYKLIDDSGEIVFQTSPEPNKKSQRAMDKVRCRLSVASKSLPIDLILTVGQCAFNRGLELKFERRFDQHKFVWSRLSPYSKKNASDKQAVIEEFTRTMGNDINSSGDVVTLRNLRPEEKALLHKEHDDNPYCLFLTSNIILEENLGMTYTVTSIYSFFNPRSKSNSYHWEYSVSKMKEFFIPQSSYPLPWLIRSFGVLMSFFDHRDRPALRSTHESLSEAVEKIIDGTPDRIDPLKTLWNLFGFKNTDWDLYRTGYNPMPVSPPKKKEK